MQEYLAKSISINIINIQINFWLQKKFFFIFERNGLWFNSWYFKQKWAHRVPPNYVTSGKSSSVYTSKSFFVEDYNFWQKFSGTPYTRNQVVRFSKIRKPSELILNRNQHRNISMMYIYSYTLYTIARSHKYWKSLVFQCVYPFAFHIEKRTEIKPKETKQNAKKKKEKLLKTLYARNATINITEQKSFHSIEDLS